MNHTLNQQDRRELVTLLQSIIRIPTEDPPGREIALARHLHAVAREWGLNAELDEFAPGRANVVARLPSSGALPALVFSAHMDTMPAGKGEWRHPPFAADEVQGRIYGRGAADMKSGLTAMLYAARRLAREGPALNGDLVLAFSAGESSSCLGAKRLVETNALDNAGSILVSEPSSLRVLVAEKGALWLKAVATGAPGHASGAAGARGAGDNAILKIVDFVHALRNIRLSHAHHPLLGDAEIRVGTVAGGSAINLTPDYAEAGIDIRYLPGMASAEIIDALTAQASGDIHLEVMDDKPPVEIPGDHPLARAGLEACRATLGEAGPVGGAAYFSDSCVLCPALGIPRIIVGPGDLGMSGQRDEYVEIDKLAAAVEIYSRLAVEML